MKIKHLIFLVFGLLTSSFGATYQFKSENLSVLIVKLQYNSYGMRGFGGSLKVRNIETNKVFESKMKKGFNPFVLVENLPVGKYKVDEVRIISGPNVLTLNNAEYFSIIEIDKPMVFYLGSYMTKKKPPIMDLNFQIIKSENDQDEKIYKQVKKKAVYWKNLKINYKTNLFLNDTTNIEIKN